MRTQTISALSGEQDLLAAPVDPAGWLTRPRSAGGRPGTLPQPDDRGVGTGEEPPRSDRRPVRRVGRVGRSTELGATRVARARRLRRAQSRILAGQQVVQAPDQLPEVVPVPAIEGYRMGRWARLALTLTVLTATAVVIALMLAGPAPHTLVDVTVGPGDSLWSIATQSAPESDPRAVIEEIRQINGITSDVLPIGVVLRVPVSGAGDGTTGS